jgi:hypothetical protein
MRRPATQINSRSPRPSCGPPDRPGTSTHHQWLQHLPILLAKHNGPKFCLASAAWHDSQRLLPHCLFAQGSSHWSGSIHIRGPIRHGKNTLTLPPSSLAHLRFRHHRANQRRCKYRNFSISIAAPIAHTSVVPAPVTINPGATANIAHSLY